MLIIEFYPSQVKIDCYTLLNAIIRSIIKNYQPLLDALSSENLNLKETRVYVKVIIDYKSLEYFIIIKKLIRHKAY